MEFLEATDPSRSVGVAEDEVRGHNDDKDNEGDQEAGNGDRVPETPAGAVLIVAHGRWRRVREEREGAGNCEGYGDDAEGRNAE